MTHKQISASYFGGSWRWQHGLTASKPRIVGSGGHTSWAMSHEKDEAPAPEPEAGLVTVLGVFSQYPIEWPGTFATGIDNHAALTAATGVQANDTFADLSALDAAWLGAHSPGAQAMASVPAPWSDIFGATASWGEIGSALNVSLLGTTQMPAASTSAAIDIVAAALAMSRAVALGVIDGAYRGLLTSQFGITYNGPGYVMPLPHQALARPGEPPGQQFVSGQYSGAYLGVPHLIIAYTGE